MLSNVEQQPVHMVVSVNKFTKSIQFNCARFASKFGVNYRVPLVLRKCFPECREKHSVPMLLRKGYDPVPNTPTTDSTTGTILDIPVYKMNIETANETPKLSSPYQ